MHAWNGKRIETSICNNDNYEVRKHILLHLLTYTGNKNIANIPKGVRDLNAILVSQAKNNELFLIFSLSV
ncbi:hypothetical protein BDA96_04G246900 [Sorghum bicolor]|nr:hypothetical protein BDA96_04G246900 [Sorghum bicolor]